MAGAEHDRTRFALRRTFCRVVARQISDPVENARYGAAGHGKRAAVGYQRGLSAGCGFCAPAGQCEIDQFVADQIDRKGIRSGEGNSPHVCNDHTIIAH